MDAKGQHWKLWLFFAFRFAVLPMSRLSAVDESPLPRTSLMCKGLVEEYWTMWLQDKCYTHHSEELSWDKAERSCIAKGGHLCKVESRSLAKTLLAGQVQRAGSKSTPFELTSRRIWWLGGKEDEDEIFRWTDGTPVRNKDWLNGIDIGTKVIGWFKTTSLCLTISHTVHLDGNLFLVEYDYITARKKNCFESHPYWCEHDLPKTVVDEPITRKVMTVTTNTTTTTLPVITNDHPKVAIGEPRTSKMIPIAATTTAPTTSTNVDVQSEGRTRRYMFRGVKIFKNKQPLAEPDDVYLATNTIECSRICAKEHRCRMINIRPQTCALYYDAPRALGKGFTSVKGSLIWEIHRY